MSGALPGTTPRAILFAVAQRRQVGELDALVPRRRGGRRVGRLFVVDLGTALHVGFRRVDEEQDRASCTDTATCDMPRTTCDVQSRAMPRRRCGAPDPPIAKKIDPKMPRPRRGMLMLSHAP